jgi:hypothetical protein
MNNKRKMKKKKKEVFCGEIQDGNGDRAADLVSS